MLISVVAGLRPHVDREPGGREHGDAVVAGPTKTLTCFTAPGERGRLVVDQYERVRAGLVDPNEVGPRGAGEGEDTGAGIEIDRRNLAVFEFLQPRGGVCSFVVRGRCGPGA